MFAFTCAILFFICSYMTTMVNALPLNSNNNKLQTVLYQERTRLYDSKADGQDKWYQSQEYEIYISVIEYYENLVDFTLNSESEDLLLNLIHMPKDSINSVLTLQAERLGFQTLSDAQIRKMPAIIGKHVQAMNAQVYNSIEPIVTLYWRTLWSEDVLEGKNNEEETMSFLSSFNGIMAKKLIQQMNEYDLLRKISIDLEQISNAMEKESWMNWIKHQVMSFNRSTKHYYGHSDMSEDFLREHSANLRTSLLMELHVQFMDFFAKIQSDITDQLSVYYED